MIATIERHGSQWLAWCPDHADGINASRAKAQAWCDEHNAKKHPEAAA